jgi:hypothetical protein
MEQFVCSHSQGNKAAQLSLEPKGSDSLLTMAKRMSETPMSAMFDLQIRGKTCSQNSANQ